MNRSYLLSAAVWATLALSACDRPAPTVVNVPPPAPPAVVPVPGPPGPQGDTGRTGAPGTSGESTTVIVVPPAASSPSR